MKQICVIGDSHLAALKLAWNAIEGEYPEIRLTFFGSPAKNLRDVRVENGALVPDSEKTLLHLQQTSGGEKEIVPERFDGFLIVALELKIDRLIQIYRNYRAEEHTNPKGVQQYISNACFLQASKGSLQSSLAFEIAEKLRSLTDRPISFLPQSFPTEDAAKRRTWKEMIECGDYALLAHTFLRAISELRLAGEHILQQPEETRTAEMFTKRDFGVGSVRLIKNDAQHPDDDYAHMNQAYGIVVLKNIIHSI